MRQSISNYQRNIYKPKEEGIIMSIIEKLTNLIDKNLKDEINTIVPKIYSLFLSNNNSTEYISDVITSKINQKIHRMVRFNVGIS